MNKKKSVSIIGGGIAGLSAAYTLKKAGLSVRVLEKNQHIGGAMKTLREKGYIHETGPNTIMETSPKVTELVKELGLDGEKVYANESANVRFVVKNGRMIELPATAGKFLSSSLFSKKTLFALMKEPFLPAWDNSYEENLAEFVLRRLNKEFLDYAINPFVAGVFAGAPEQISVKHGFKRLYALEQKYGSLIKGQILGARERKKSKQKSKQTAKMFSFQQGLSQFTERLAEFLKDDIFLNTEIKSVEHYDGQWHIKSTNAEEYSSDIVIYAGTAYNLSVLKSKTDFNEKVKSLDEIYHPPVTTLSLGFDRQDIGDALEGFGVLIPEKEKFNILGSLFVSSLFPNRTPKDHVLLTVFIGGTRQPEKSKLSEKDMLEMTLRDLDRLIDLKGQPDYVHFTHWKKAIPQYQVGYGKYKNCLRELETDNPGLYFTGNYVDGISAADTIVNALELSSRIIDGQ